mmetsp:Transcript_32691/g.68759  ORF Transcript_32691/g.68759 Transcript_32691/m.68759 type:complete len:95 (+) Transcript_32691:95-379(+)
MGRNYFSFIYSFPCLYYHFSLSTANACFWTAFGFGVMDWIIMVPNGLGAILGFIQMFLRLVIPSREILPSSSEIERPEVMDVEIEATASTKSES